MKVRKNSSKNIMSINLNSNKLKIFNNYKTKDINRFYNLYSNIKKKKEQNKNVFDKNTKSRYAIKINKIFNNIIYINKYNNTKLCSLLKNKIKSLNFLNLESIPSLSFKDFLKNYLFNITNDSNICICALVLIDRMINNGFILTKDNMFLSYLICFLISTKVHEDILYKERDICNYYKLEPIAYSRLEKIILDFLNYNVHITDNEFYFYNSNFIL